jgi:hypothetical protein
MGRYLRWPRISLTHARRKLTVCSSSQGFPINKNKSGTFLLPWLRLFRDFSSVVTDSKVGARPAFPLRYGVFTKVPEPHRAPWSRLRHSGFEPQKAIQPVWIQCVYKLLSYESFACRSWPKATTKNRSRKPNPSYSLGVCSRGQQCGHTQKWPNRPRDVDLRFAQFSALSHFGCCLVGDAVYFMYF